MSKGSYSKVKQEKQINLKCKFKNTSQQLSSCWSFSATADIVSLGYESSSSKSCTSLPWSFKFMSPLTPWEIQSLVNKIQTVAKISVNNKPDRVFSSLQMDFITTASKIAHNAILITETLLINTPAGQHAILCCEIRTYLESRVFLYRNHRNLSVHFLQDRAFRWGFSFPGIQEKRKEYQWAFHSNHHPTHGVRLRNCENLPWHFWYC